MRLTRRDAVATILVAAIAIPYIGYVIRGSMPFIQDPTGMSATGLILGALAATVGGWIVLREGTFSAISTVGLGIVSAVLGILALISEHLFNATAADWVLGAFMVSIGALWALALLRHSGVLPPEQQPASRLGHA